MSVSEGADNVLEKSTCLYSESVEHAGKNKIGIKKKIIIKICL
jgi:hypothetical protein